MIQDCQHRRHNGTSLIECESTHLLHRNPKMVHPTVCLSCPYVDRPNDPINGEVLSSPRSLDCHFRGPETRRQTADLCGLRGREFPVYQCRLHHVECTAHRICQRQTIRSCAVCRSMHEDVAPGEPPRS